MYYNTKHVALYKSCMIVICLWWVFSRGICTPSYPYNVVRVTGHQTTTIMHIIEINNIIIPRIILVCDVLYTHRVTHGIGKYACGYCKYIAYVIWWFSPCCFFAGRCAIYTCNIRSVPWVWTYFNSQHVMSQAVQYVYYVPKQLSAHLPS
jgi:hypothetical protein